MPRHRGALAWVWFGVVVALAIELAGLSLLNRGEYDDGIASFLFLSAAATAWAAIGAVIVARTANLVGWVMMAVATVMVGSPAAEQYIVYAVITAPGSLPLVTFAARAGSVSIALFWGIGLLFLVFPTGRPPTPRWRPVLWALVTASVLHGLGWLVRLDDAGRAVLLGPWTDRGVLLQNRLAVPALTWVWQVGVAIGLTASAAAIASLVIRFRGGADEERAQIRWLAFVGGLILAIFLTAFIPGLRDSDVPFLLLFLTVLFGIPTACGIALLRYHLYDIDVVIKKTVVFGLLAAFITVVYAAIVGVAGSRFRGSQVGSFLAAATLAVLFAPARDRARKIADRLVYGKRATPYEVLAEFSDRVGNAYADDDVLSRMVEVLMEGTGATGARVSLRVDAGWRDAAAVGERAGEETVVEVTHRGEELGSLAVSMPMSDPMNPAKRKLVEDLASQAGLVLRNVKLIEDLKASRQRLVAAQDEERRRIERNIHDGAQQQLVALAVQLRLAAQMVGTDEGKQRTLLASLSTRANEALEDLRDLARGIYPPLLMDKGLAAALEAQARKAAVPTTIRADATGRFSQEVEAAVYFCVLEALQNVAKYAEASRAIVTLSDGSGELRFSVVDDGKGFDTVATGYGTGLQGIADRIAAIGGEVTIASVPGGGTTISGVVPG